MESMKKNELPPGQLIFPGLMQGVPQADFPSPLKGWNLKTDFALGNWKWSFESDQNWESLNDPKQVQKGLRLCGASLLYRHSVLSALGKDLEKLKTEHSLSQHLELFQFIYDNRPFTNPDDCNIYADSSLFDIIRFIKKIRLKKPFTKQEIADLIMYYSWFCRTTKSRETFVEIKPELVEIYNQTKDDKPDWKEETKEESMREEKIVLEEKKDLKLINEEVLEWVEDIIAKLNKKSFYFIKVQLESLSKLIFPPENLKNRDQDEIKDIVQEIYDKILQSIEIYPTKIFSQVKDAIGPLLKENSRDSWKLWVNLLKFYYSCIRELNSAMLTKLRHPFDQTTASFLNILLNHPHSFLTSKKVLEVNWKLVSSILQKYKTYNETQKSLKEFPESQLADSFFRSNIVTIAFSTHFQLGKTSESEGGPRSLFIPVADKNSRHQKYSHLRSDFSQKEDAEFLDALLERAIEGFLRDISKHIGKYESLKKMDDINLHFYFSHENNDLFEHIRRKLLKDIFPRIEKAIGDEHFSKENLIEKTVGKESLSSQNLIENDCAFYYTIPEKRPDSSNIKKEEEKAKFSQRKVSFFDYQFLQSVVLGAPSQAFATPVAFFILGKDCNELDKIREKLTEASLEIKEFNELC